MHPYMIEKLAASAATTSSSQLSATADWFKLGATRLRFAFQPSRPSLPSERRCPDPSMRPSTVSSIGTASWRAHVRRRNNGRDRRVPSRHRGALSYGIPRGELR